MENSKINWTDHTWNPWVGECEFCGNAPATTRTKRGENYCGKCAAAVKEYGRKYLVRQMGVAKICGEFWSWKSLPNEPATVDDGEGNAIEMCSKRRYLEALKERFLGNTRYDQAVVTEYVASVEKKIAAVVAEGY